MDIDYNSIFGMSIDQEATGKRIVDLLQEGGYSRMDVMRCLGISTKQALWKWQTGRSIPSTDNLVRLSAMMGMPIEKMIVVKTVDRIVLMEEVQKGKNNSIIE